MQSENLIRAHCECGRTESFCQPSKLKVRCLFRCTKILFYFWQLK